MPRLVLLVLCAGCITPPAVRSAGNRVLDLATFPAGTQRVEIGDTRKLRGVFVPGDPIVLLLPESGGSITMGAARSDGYGLAWDLRALGMGLLCIDYGGVGASSGHASVKHLRADVAAMWREALRRTNGDAGRVVVRGLSLGGLGASALLEAGAEPAAVIVAAPVRAETAVRRFADEWTEGAGRVLAKLFVRRPLRTDLVRALARTPARTLVFAGADDPYLADDERAMLRRSADVYVEAAGTDHYDSVRAAQDILEEERGLYLELFPELPRLKERLSRIRRNVPDAPPDGRLAPLLAHFACDAPAVETAAALALTPQQLRDSPGLENWLRSLPPLPLNAARALVDFDDPAGRMNLVDFFGWQAWVEKQPLPHTPERLLAAIREDRRHRRVTVKWTLYLGGIEPTVREWPIGDLDRPEKPLPDTPAVARLRLPEREMLRQGLLLALKAARIPARTVADREVEAWSPAGWRRVAMTRE